MSTIHASRLLLASFRADKGLALLAFLLATLPSFGQELPVRAGRKAPSSAERANLSVITTNDPFTTESLFVALRSYPRKPRGAPRVEGFKYVLPGDSVSPLAILLGSVRSTCPGVARTATQVNGVDLSLLDEDGRPVPGAVFRSHASGEAKGMGGEFQLLIRPTQDSLAREVERMYGDIATAFKEEAARTTDTLFREHLLHTAGQYEDGIVDTLAKLSIEASNPSITGTLLPATSMLFLRPGRYVIRGETTMRCGDGSEPVRETTERSLTIDELKSGERIVDPLEELRSLRVNFDSIRKARDAGKSDAPARGTSP